MGGKVPEMKCSFWCERDIRGTNATKGEKYSGVNAAIRKPNLVFIKKIIVFENNDNTHYTLC